MRERFFYFWQTNGRDAHGRRWPFVPHDKNAWKSIVAAYRAKGEHKRNDKAKDHGNNAGDDHVAPHIVIAL